MKFPGKYSDRPHQGEQTGGNTIITNHATSNFMPVFIKLRKIDRFIVKNRVKNQVPENCTHKIHYGK